MSSGISVLCFLIFGASGGGDFNECVDAGVGKGVVVDVQRQLLN
jgi:hypothetical protein